MSKAFKASSVLKAIGEERLKLYSNASKGYWYWEFDDIKQNIFETEMVYVMRLSDMSLERWIEEGKEFCQKTLAKVESRKETSNAFRTIRKEKD